MKLITAPETEPVTLAQTKEHLRIPADDTTEDTHIETLIKSARQRAEHLTGRAFITQTWEMILPGFTLDAVPLPMGEVQSVTSVAYVDSEGENQTLAGTIINRTTMPMSLCPAVSTRWPRTQRGHPAPVTIRYVAGYGDADAVPEDIKSAILMLVADLHHRRAPSLRSESLGDAYSFSYRDGEGPILSILAPYCVVVVH